MGNRKNDIEKYLRGELTASEMHALEREALRDPFLAEAMEGIERTGQDTFLFDLKELRRSVYQRTKGKRGKIISITNWSIGIAAGLILIAVSSVYLISIMNNRQKKELASNEKSSAQNPATPSEKQKMLSDSATLNAGDTQLGLIDPMKKNPPSAGPQKPKQPEVLSIATADSDAAGEVNEGVKVTEVAQAEEMKKEPQKVVIAELTEFPPVLAKDSSNELILDKKSKDVASVTPAESTARKALGFVSVKSIRGKVTSAEDGSPLPGVNVLVKGTSTGTVTDDEGLYEIPLNDSKQNLVFSFIGLENVEAETSSRQEVNVQMTPDYSQLSEVVVTGSDANELAKEDHPVLQFAEPRGGREAFQQYLEEKMNYPDKALENKIEGRVTVQFTVEPNGQIGDFKVIKGLGFGCDDEVIRLIKEGPSWSPTKRNDQPVKDKVKVRLKFDIPD